MVVLNDKKIKNPQTIEKLLKKYKLPEHICIIVNGRVIKRENWSKVILKDGDRIEVVGFVGGG